DAAGQGGLKRGAELTAPREHSSTPFGGVCRHFLVSSPVSRYMRCCFSLNCWFCTPPATGTRAKERICPVSYMLLIPKSTAVWLVANTALSFDQIAQFCKLHPLEVKAIADGEAAQGIKGHDPVNTGQLSREEIARGEADQNHKLKLSEPKVRVPETKRRGPR